MQSRFGLAHFWVFVVAGFFSFAACCFGLFQFLTHDRLAAAQLYNEAALSYFEKSSHINLSQDSRAYLLDLAQENSMHALRLNEKAAKSWSVMARILKAQGNFDLAHKASKIAGRLDPDLADQFYPHKLDEKNWTPIFVLSHYEAGKALKRQ